MTIMRRFIFLSIVIFGFVSVLAFIWVTPWAAELPQPHYKQSLSSSSTQSTKSSSKGDKNTLINEKQNDSVSELSTEQDEGYSCRVPCTGAMPSRTVEQDCARIKKQEQCLSYSSTEFPFNCQWLPAKYECPPIP